jgi:hypothetical protein
VAFEKEEEFTDRALKLAETGKPKSKAYLVWPLLRRDSCWRNDSPMISMAYFSFLFWITGLLSIHLPPRGGGNPYFENHPCFKAFLSQFTYGLTPSRSALRRNFNPIRMIPLPPPSPNLPVEPSYVDTSWKTTEPLCPSR